MSDRVEENNKHIHGNYILDRPISYYLKDCVIMGDIIISHKEVILLDLFSVRIDGKIVNPHEVPIYGINTSFVSVSNKLVPSVLGKRSCPFGDDEHVSKVKKSGGITCISGPGGHVKCSDNIVSGGGRITVFSGASSGSMRELMKHFQHMKKPEPVEPLFHEYIIKCSLDYLLKGGVVNIFLNDKTYSVVIPRGTKDNTVVLKEDNIKFCVKEMRHPHFQRNEHDLDMLGHCILLPKNLENGYFMVDSLNGEQFYVDMKEQMYTKDTIWYGKGHEIRAGTKIVIPNAGFYLTDHCDCHGKCKCPRGNLKITNILVQLIEKSLPSV